MKMNHEVRINQLILFNVTILTIVKTGLLLSCNVGNNAQLCGLKTTFEVRSCHLSGEVVSPKQARFSWFHDALEICP